MVELFFTIDLGGLGVVRGGEVQLRNGQRMIFCFEEKGGQIKAYIVCCGLSND